jgi:hypothetical protein
MKVLWEDVGDAVHYVPFVCVVFLAALIVLVILWMHG